MTKPQLYAVRIEAHGLRSGLSMQHHRIPESEYKVRADSPVQAIRLGVRMAARDSLGLGMYFKPWLRAIARHAKAVEMGEDWTTEVRWDND
jgi:hypothetical protein